MNGALSYSFQTQRLALGLTLLDQLRGSGPRHPLRVEIERQSPHIRPQPEDAYRFVQHGIQLPVALNRHDSGRYSLLYHPGIRTSVTLRLYDRAGTLIPRRISVPLLSLAQVEAIEAAEPLDYYGSRQRTIALFANSGYHLAGGETGLRGRVLRDGGVMRWAYLEASSPISNAVLARARANQHGEFLLILPPRAAPSSQLNTTLDVRVSVIGPAVAPQPPTTALPALDPLWDIPVEVLPPPGVPDTVASGEDPPAGHVTALSATQVVSFQIGRILTGRQVDDFDFDLS